MCHLRDVLSRLRLRDVQLWAEQRQPCDTQRWVPPLRMRDPPAMMRTVSQVLTANNPLEGLAHHSSPALAYPPAGLLRQVMSGCIHC